jgi:pimeloyl-ACP methyl ester carboxylesterase
MGMRASNGITVIALSHAGATMQVQRECRDSVPALAGSLERFITAQTYWRLIRWLGPWAGGVRSPVAVKRRRMLLPANGKENCAVEVFVYAPADRPAVGSYVLVHGLNPRGPSDARCDRFARILAHAGFVVMSPRLDALTQMRLDASAIGQLSCCLEAMIGIEEHPVDTLPGVFSISFGSHPALLTAASLRARHLVGSLVVFGGYANFVDTCRFMSGFTSPRDDEPQPDPTCRAGLAINMAPVLFREADCHRLTQAWWAFVIRVWGMPEMKESARFSEFAQELAGGLPAGLARVFLQGCGVIPGFSESVEDALTRIDVDSMDPRRHLSAIRCPVHLIHGRRDDVIPCSQMEVLAAGLSNTRARRYLTGFYDHSRGDSRTLALGRLPALAKEAKTMGAMVHALALGGTRLRPARS